MNQDILSAKAILDIYKIIGYDAMAVGPHDLAAGIDLLVDSLLKGSPWISANLITNEGRTVFPPWVIKETPGGNIGILGLTADASLPDGYKLARWEETLPQYLDKLSPACDFIILLSNLDNEVNDAIALKFPQIYLIISADQKKGNIPPALVRNTLLTQTHTRGKYLGILTVSWSKLKIWQSALQNDSKILPEILTLLDTQIKTRAESNDDETILNMLQAYRSRLTSFAENVDTSEGGTFTFQFRSLPKHIEESAKINDRISQLKAEIATTNKNTQAQARQKDQRKQVDDSNLKRVEFAGAESCRSCHEKQYIRWRQTNHAHALDSLTVKQQQYNIQCLSCHVTRDMTTTPEALANQNLLSLPDELLMVSCESCHGVGLNHVQSRGESALSPITESTCKACHTPEMDDNFQLKEKLSLLGCPQK